MPKIEASLFWCVSKMPNAEFKDSACLLRAGPATALLAPEVAASDRPAARTGGALPEHIPASGDWVDFQGSPYAAYVFPDGVSRRHTHRRATVVGL